MNEFYFFLQPWGGREGKGRKMSVEKKEWKDFVECMWSNAMK